MHRNTCERVHARLSNGGSGGCPDRPSSGNGRCAPPGRDLCRPGRCRRRRAPRRERWCARHRPHRAGLRARAVAVAPPRQLRLADLEIFGDLAFADDRPDGPAIFAAPRKGFRLACTRARSRSVAVSRASRLPARSCASSVLRQTINRSPGNCSGAVISSRSRSSNNDSCNGPSSLAILDGVAAQARNPVRVCGRCGQLRGQTAEPARPGHR
jgi:hypothetical protein